MSFWTNGKKRKTTNKKTHKQTTGKNPLTFTSHWGK